MAATAPAQTSGNSAMSPSPGNKDIAPITTNIASSSASASTKLSEAHHPPSAVEETPAEVFDLMRSWVQLYMDSGKFDASHDFAHIERVLANARHILAVESGRPGAPAYNRSIIELSALLHDVDDRKYFDYNNDAKADREEAAEAAAAAAAGETAATTTTAVASAAPAASTEIISPIVPDTPAVDQGLRDTIRVVLENAGASAATARAVQAVCAHVSFTTERRQPMEVRDAMRLYPELAIVQDADRLDALGAVGVARTFAFTGAMSARGLHNRRKLNETIAHFHEKLERLERMMKTQEGRRMAAERSERLREFRRWFEEENGDVR